MDNRAICDKAASLEGCLSKQKTVRTDTRRRWGRALDEDYLSPQNPFVQDEYKITASKSFRVAADKTQVFSFRRTELIRSRLTHMAEVDGVSVRTSELLGLNTSLVRAGSLAHDIGHTALGHQGEMCMKKLLGRDDFTHEVMGVVMAQKIERGGKGLNLTWHTLRMIARDSGNPLPSFPELQLLRITDGVTYLLADANDIGTRMRYPFSNELRETLNYFGSTQRERVDTITAELVIESAEMNKVSFEHSPSAQKFKQLRKLMYDVYFRVTQQNVEVMMSRTLESLTRLNIGDPFLLLALMTDKDVALMGHEPAMTDLQAFNETTVSEIVPRLPEIQRLHGKIDLCDPDLNW